MYVESCTILVVVNHLSRPVVVLDGLPGLYGFKYDSATACGLLLYLYSYKLVGSAIASITQPPSSSHPPLSPMFHWSHGVDPASSLSAWRASSAVASFARCPPSRSGGCLVMRMCRHHPMGMLCPLLSSTSGDSPYLHITSFGGSWSTTRWSSSTLIRMGSSILRRSSPCVRGS